MQPAHPVWSASGAPPGTQGYGAAPVATPAMATYSGSQLHAFPAVTAPAMVGAAPRTTTPAVVVGVLPVSPYSFPQARVHGAAGEFEDETCPCTGMCWAALLLPCIAVPIVLHDNHKKADKIAMQVFFEFYICGEFSNVFFV